MEKSFIFRIESNMLDKIKRKSFELGISAAEFVRCAIQEKIEREK